MYLVEGDVLAHHTAQAIDECREGDGTWGVTVPPHLGPGAREVEHSTALQAGGGGGQFKNTMESETFKVDRGVCTIVNTRGMSGMPSGKKDMAVCGV